MSTPTDFGILLGLAFQHFKSELHHALAERGYDDVGSAYGYVFRALAEGPRKLGELAELLGITAQGAVKIVNEMEARGYVERSADPSDGRAKRIALAKRGRGAMQAARRFHARYERELRGHIGAEASANLRAALEHLAGGVDGDGKHPPLRAV